MKRKIFIIFTIIISAVSFSQSQKKILNLASEELLEERFLGNSVGDVIFSKGAVWIAGSHGLSKSTDGCKSWTNYFSNKAFVKPTIASLDIKGDTIWASLVYDSSGIDIGAGYSYSLDGGKSWNHLPQAVDKNSDSLIVYGNKTIYSLPVTVNQQNVTYCTNIKDNTIWIASWSSGIRKSTDFGKTFQRVLLPPDNLWSVSPDDAVQFRVNPRYNNNHLGFAVLAVDSLEIWAGTADGVNKSTDGGKSWKKYNSQSPSGSSLIGDWVIHISEQQLLGKKRIWVTNWKSEDIKKDNFGVCYTENGGDTWVQLLKGTKANFITFKDSIIYIGTKDGILRSDNDGKSFELFSNIYDKTRGYKILYPQIMSISVQNDTVAIGSSDGLAYTIENANTRFGSEWHVMRAFQSAKTNEAYAYPNPFSPNDESVRIHYKMPKSSCKISIDIFDFAMNHIKNITNGITKSGSLEQEDVWDGSDKNSKKVSNGVYFYKIKLDDENVWGKILVLE